MKNISLFLLPVLFLLPAICSFDSSHIANNKKSKIILYLQPVPDSKSFVLRLANLQRMPTKILIKGQKGNIYYSESLKGRNGYRKMLDLQKLEAGFYLLEIIQKGGTKSGPILLKHGSVVFLGKQKSEA